MLVGGARPSTPSVLTAGQPHTTVATLVWIWARFETNLGKIEFKFEIEFEFKFNLELEFEVELKLEVEFEFGQDIE
jgi:hypothetical protein